MTYRPIWETFFCITMRINNGSMYGKAGDLLRACAVISLATLLCSIAQKRIYSGATNARRTSLIRVHRTRSLPSPGPGKLGVDGSPCASKDSEKTGPDD